MFFTPWLRTLGNRLRSRSVRKDRSKSLQKRSEQPAAAMVELLEDRTLLTIDVTAFAATSATITGGADANALVLGQNAGGFLTHNLSGNPNATGAYADATDFDPGAGTQTIAVATAGTIAVNLGDDADSITIDDSQGLGLQGAASIHIDIDGEGGSDELIGPDTAAMLYAVTAANAGNLGGAGVTDFANLENLTGGTQADTYDVTAAGSLGGAIDGKAGNDVLLGTGIDAVVLTGADANGYAGTEPNITGNFDHIVTLTGTGGTLTGQAVDSVWTLSATPTYFNGAQVLNHSGFATLQGDSGEDTFNVTFANAFNLNGGGNDDEFDIDAVLTGTADGQAGADTLEGTEINAVALTGADGDGFAGADGVTAFD
ncbi:MAG: hypothetical protein CMJ65_09040, partial [Planctomycetaceae bacterium]|nr:hypothetical protein [Planctomycetaceae bacterium]